jgi:hypothetical protein
MRSSAEGMSNSAATNGRLETVDCSGGHHMCGENHNCLPLLIPIIFSQAHTNVSFIETQLYFM